MKDGHPYGEHLQAAAKMPGPQGRQAAAELAGPSLPEACAYVWTWFCELLSARSFGPHGPNPIAHAEIAAWAALTRRAPKPWELELLRALDVVWLSAKPEHSEGG